MTLTKVCSLGSSYSGRLDRIEIKVNKIIFKSCCRLGLVLVLSSARVLCYRKLRRLRSENKFQNLEAKKSALL